MPRRRIFTWDDVRYTKRTVVYLCAVLVPWARLQLSGRRAPPRAPPATSSSVVQCNARRYIVKVPRNPSHLFLLLSSFPLSLPTSPPLQTLYALPFL